MLFSDVVSLGVLINELLDLSSDLFLTLFGPGGSLGTSPLSFFSISLRAFELTLG